MERLLNDGWSFWKTELGSSLHSLENAQWQNVRLPHDWLISQVSDLYEDSDGWYRRTLTVEKTDAHVRVLRFDGVYMNSEVFVNGQKACENPYGYTAFDCDLTPYLHEGENEILVHVRHQGPNSRWYSGAGIFRDVVLYTLAPCHIALDGIYVSQSLTDDGYQLWINAEIVGEPTGEALCHRLLDASGACVAQAKVDVRQSGEAAVSMSVKAPKLWSCDAPNLYHLETTLGEQVACQNIGFRTIRFTTESGLFVNDQHVKLKGVCLHHDLGALGAAYNRSAARRQLKKMQEMGVNALRTSHNPPARETMNLCDEMGILVIDEAFDMWERAKTTYDYARFFPDWHDRDVRSWVRRDRNHPSLLMWSIGNEIYDTHADERGQEVTRMLMACVREHDPRMNAPVTIGSNYMPWENAQKCADIVKLAGYNYGEKYYDAQHEAHPDWIIYGSETSSVVSSRAVYHFPLAQNSLSDEDMQCSALGNSETSWGARSFETCIVGDLNTPYSLGQFIWSGIDYIGEPTPYHTKNSYFGVMDTACFPKDAWYLFRSLWRDAPMVHIGVYWDFNDVQLIDVPVYSNLAEVELLLNGKSLGRQKLDPTDEQKCRGLWQLPYEKGVLEARAYDESGALKATAERRSFGDAARIHLQAEAGELLANGEDIAFVTISMQDKDGNPIENANTRVHVSVAGEGCLLGLDNGDSADTDEYQTDCRQLFGGLLLAMIGTTRKAGEITITVSAEGMPSEALMLQTKAAEAREGSEPFASLCAASKADQTIPVRKIALHAQGSTKLNKAQPECVVTAELLPANATDTDIAWRITTAAGIDTNCAKLTVDGNKVTVHALGDGVLYLRASCNNGYPHPRVLSQMEIVVEGMGQPFINPYQFVSAGLHDVERGEVGAGNDHGVSTARDGETVFGFTNIDFGLIGSDEITLPIFAIDGGMCDFDLWLGVPDEAGSELLGHFDYQKPPMWNVYQEETYRLPKLIKGVQTLCFKLHQKAHIKGFTFKKPQKAYAKLSALQCDEVYGDSFTRTERGVEGIGNNVTLVFNDMDFDGATNVTLHLNGRTPLAGNSVHVRMKNDAGEDLAQIAEFEGTQEGIQSFPMKALRGNCTVSLVFLPGSQFDLFDLRFERA